MITPEETRLTLRRMAAYIRRHAAGSPNLEAWADFIEALPPDGDEALAFTRAQREIGYPEKFTPRCDNGLYVRKYGLAHRAPPHAGVLRELVGLEGMDEPLPPGSYFPMDPTPVRDGLPLWAVDVRVIGGQEILARWLDVDELTHPRLDEVRGYGYSDPDEPEMHFETELRIWAADEAEACAIAEPLVDEVVGGAPARRRLRAAPAYADEYFDLPRSPEDYESHVVKRRWQRFVPSATGGRVIWHTGAYTLDRVDVEETPQRVTITVWEHSPPRFAEGGVPIAVAAIGLVQSFDVTLRSPLGERELIDGATGRRPDDIDEFDYEGRGLLG